MAKKKAKSKENRIAVNRQATHNYFIEDRFEAGIALQGWEVKSMRDNRVQIKESYITIKNGEAFLFGAHISALPSASSHVVPESRRLRKLLLHRQELNRLIGHVERKGYTLVPLSLYWKKGLVKLELGLAKGKQQHDKRAATKERDWQREKQRVLKHA
ncbi:MAG: SsrA-binding protein SmpB [Methylococcales bacterium]